MQALLFAVFCYASAAYDWTLAEKVLHEAIADQAFPGCTVLVADKTGILWNQGYGNFTYGAIPPFSDKNELQTPHTIFDMASCTKVTTTTTAVAQFYQRGELPLETLVVDLLGSDWGVNGKQDIKVLNLLLHNSGLFPDPVPFWNTKAFGCPQCAHYNPLKNFDCSEKIFASVLSQKLQNPIGAKYVYSDLNFITLMHIVGRLAKSKGHIQPRDLEPSCAHLNGIGVTDQCYFEAYIRKFVLEAADMRDSGFNPPKHLWKRCAPAENDTAFLHSTYQGEVSDGNAFASGGIAGHAGLFSNQIDIHKFMAKLMWAPAKSDYLNKATMELFVKEYNHSQSSRALGWNTNDPDVPDEGFGRACGNLSPRTWMHTGYTGTLMCGDPDRELILIFLTNRVYPTDANIKIRKVRPLLSTAVQVAYDKGRADLDLIQK